MARQSVEEIKAESRGLYGKIIETLISNESHFQEAEYQLLKFQRYIVALVFLVLLLLLSIFPLYMHYIFFLQYL